MTDHRTTPTYTENPYYYEQYIYDLQGQCEGSITKMPEREHAAEDVARIDRARAALTLDPETSTHEEIADAVDALEDFWAHSNEYWRGV